MNASPLADAPQLMQEYERLLAERFTQDPDAPTQAAAPEPAERGTTVKFLEQERRQRQHQREERLRQLHQMLFERPQGRARR